VDGNGTVNLKDAILALQVSSGLLPVLNVFQEVDVNGNTKIGTQEVIYVLQIISEIRTSK